MGLEAVEDRAVEVLEQVGVARLGEPGEEFADAEAGVARDLFEREGGVEEAAEDLVGGGVGRVVGV